MVRRVSRLPRGRWADGRWPRGRWVGPVVLALLCGATLVAPATAQDQIGLALGTTPPAVTLADLDGNPVDLGLYVGKKPVLVEFWATWCPLCRKLLPRLAAAHAKADTSVEFLIVAVGVGQTPHSIQRHLAEEKMPGRVLWDGEGKAVRAFEAPGTSYVVTLDRTGRVVYTGYGADQDIAAAVEKALR
jgi:thiol-disulfide isomerase/thioredoxin